MLTLSAIKRLFLSSRYIIGPIKFFMTLIYTWYITDAEPGCNIEIVSNSCSISRFDSMLEKIF